jgi:hypothetical protein
MKIEFKNLGSAVLGLFSATPEIKEADKTAITTALEQDKADIAKAYEGMVSAEDVQAQITAALEGPNAKIEELEATIGDRDATIVALNAKVTVVEADAKELETLRAWKAKESGEIGATQVTADGKTVKGKDDDFTARKEAKEAEMTALKEKYPKMFL